MTADEAQSLIREAVDTNDHSWFENEAVAFKWEGSNIFMVRDGNNAEHYAFGSTTVIMCLMAGHIGPAINQQARLEFASEMRNRRFKRKRGDA